MKITPYGFCGGLGWLLGSLIIGLDNFNPKLIFICLMSPFLQIFTCKNCDTTYSASSYLAVFPILMLLFLKCSYAKLVIVGSSFGLVIARLGCYLSGCCTGKECKKSFPFAIKYKKKDLLKKFPNYKNYLSDSDDIYVYPTILLELMLQLLIVLIVFKLDYGLVYYGILTGGLLLTTNNWRLTGRHSSMWIPVSSSILFSIIAFFKCGKVKTDKIRKINYKYLPIFISISILMSLAASNDFNVADIMNKLK